MVTKADAAPHAAQHAAVDEATRSTPDAGWIAALRTDFPTEPDVDRVLTRKLERRGRDRHRQLTTGELSSRLNAFLAKQLDGDFTVTDLEPLPGGASKEQFSFALERDGRTDRMVLRMSPPASVVETGRVRELQMLRAVEGVLPVPHAYWATEELADFGEPAIISGFVLGVASPTGGVKKASGIGTGYAPENRAALASQFVRHLATLHTLPVDDKDLSAFVIPGEGTTEAADIMLTHWFRVWAEDSLEEHPTMALARRWLWDNRPALDHVSLLHGDWRNGNFLFDESTSQITALLDWELAAIGDRHLDLAYLLLPMWGHTDDEGTFLCAGLASREALIAEYEQASGLTVDEDRLRWYSVLNLFWAATACYASGVRAARSGMTHLEVMMCFVSGLAAASVFDINRLIKESLA